MEREATSQVDLERVFSSVTRGNVDGVFPVSPNLYTKHSSLIIRLASEKRLPLNIHRKEWVEQGVLFSYSHNLASVGSPTARYIDRIFKGASPADLPVQLPSQFELVINLKTSGALGLTVPPTLLYRADKLIR